METSASGSKITATKSNTSASAKSRNSSLVMPQTNNDQKRRSSSRSIKRKRFDDEIVEYRIPSASPLSKVGRARTQSQCFVQPAPPPPLPPPSPAALQPSPLTNPTASNPRLPALSKIDLPASNLMPSPETSSLSVLSKPSKYVTSSSTTGNRTHSGQASTSKSSNRGAASRKQKSRSNSLSSPGPQFISSNSNVDKRKNKNSKKGKKGGRGGGNNQITTKDLGRWKPIDDLALIIGIQQTNDLRTVHRGTKFSCKFTVQELQSRWYSLLYEEPISRISVAAMRNLHPELVESVQSKALYTIQEEELLGTFKSTETPIIENFQELLDKNSALFYSARTAKCLMDHWQLMKSYSLLPDQTIRPLYNEDHPLSFSDAEDEIQDTDIDHKDEALEMELALADRRNKREIRQLENELTRWTVLVDSLTGIGFTPEFDNQTLAVLRGRLVRYLMRSKEITFGRNAKDYKVDVDLTLEGPAYKVSRKQGTIKLRSNGDFFIANEGKRPIYIDGMPLMQGNKSRLSTNCVVEITGLRFVFLVNYDLINAIRHESAKTGAPLN